MKGGEPWFLPTNLPAEISRTMILHRYQERFEIEEAFKDMKWLQRLEWQRVGRPEVIRSLLLFVFLGWWLLWRYSDKQPSPRNTHPKKRLSWFRQACEQFQTQTSTIAQLYLLT